MFLENYELGELIAESERNTVRRARRLSDGRRVIIKTSARPYPSVRDLRKLAFEHHLRLDGTGYPEGAKRSALNLGTMMCSIADVYDAMRSQRAYQQAFPTDRVLAVLKKDDGAHFDAQLVRRFVQLLGIYPPGTLVTLASGTIAVVTRVHAPDPYRPRVKLLFDIYHVQIMHGDVIRRLEQCKDILGHIHTAGNPGRAELDDTQEINYPPIMKKLLALKYDGFVGQEFIPTRDAKTGLAEALRVCDV